MKTYEREGFTLIELLMTITIFAMVLAVLVAGLSSGARAWRSVRRHQERAAQIASAFEVLASDVRHAAPVLENVPALVERADDEDVLWLTRLPSKRDLRVLEGGVWSRVEHRMESQEGTVGARWVRRVQAFAGAGAFGEAEEETLLEGLRVLHFSYIYRGSHAAYWQEETRLPAAVVVDLAGVRGERQQKTVGLPLGMLADAGG